MRRGWKIAMVVVNLFFALWILAALFVPTTVYIDGCWSLGEERAACEAGDPKYAVNCVGLPEGEDTCQHGDPVKAFGIRQIWVALGWLGVNVLLIVIAPRFIREPSEPTAPPAERSPFPPSSSSSGQHRGDAR